MIKPISISLSPNTEPDDINLALKLQFLPWLWKKGKAIKELEEQFKSYIGLDYTFSFNSGRSALMAILDALQLREGDEVLLQSFTCNAVPNPVIWSRLKPVYVDVNENTFNMDSLDLEKKITPRSRAVIVQHTFGLPGFMDKILEICSKNNLILIEDCAHSLGATYKDKKVGTLGRVSFFSFSRDKVISSVYGGMVATNDPSLAEKIKHTQDKFGYPSYFWIFQQLLHPTLMNWLILPTYSIFGKYFLIILQSFHILSKAVHWKEKRGQKPDYFPRRMPNAIAILAINQLKKLERFNDYRTKIAETYTNDLENSNFIIVGDHEGRTNIFLRFPVRHKYAHEIIKKAWKNNILIGDWYDKVIAPHDTKLEKILYNLGDCPVAERLSRETFNLPTHINISDQNIEKIMSFLQKWK